MDDLRSQAALVWERVAEYLERTRTAEKSGTVDTPEALRAQALRFLETPEPSLQRILDPVFQYTRDLHAPPTLGHQVAPPLPLAALVDGVVSVLNQGNAVFEMSPWGTATELAMVERLASYVGWGPHGFATGGGTLANVTAILAARNRAFPSAWTDGAAAFGGAVLLVPEDAHYSFARAAGILGIGTHQLVAVPVDSARRMRAVALKAVLAKLDGEGRRAFAICATAGSTAAGAYDPLDEIADVSESRGIWLHVDGCHGASVLLSEALRGRMQGVARADSLSWDAHKLLWMPSVSTFLLFRQEEEAGRAFPRGKASYLFDPEAETDAAWDGGRRTFECTRRSLALPLWAAWSHYGPGFFARRLERITELAQAFHARVGRSGDFVAGPVPESNIVLFRYEPPALAGAPAEERARFQRCLRRAAVRDGAFYLTTADLGPESYLRTVWMAPDAPESTGDRLLERLRTLAQSL